ncbi:hypothetical protein GKE82_02610 [Conexibacter sp. W3-3-2]|uniref:DUF4267 domain-containing protein n=1 Tax=Paraconexibacter algicola TaxID=2133960 RepID=A0A2T4UCN8_9ACTN|nr:MULTISPECIES: hypothetical protein [Solirubrobacterales]MTD43224.1 hypothetical protein [Conexibacter sp. W3-3-2]PTL54972.1 hypothetical protein C7Y72_20595 [Paraconexibacter algicola]
MSTTRLALGATRALVGLAAWTAPDQTVTVFGIDRERHDRFVSRLFGARDFALGASVLAADPQHLRAATTVGVLVDSVDAIAGFDEYRRGTLSTRAFVLGPCGAVLLAVLGVLVLREESAGTVAG